MGLEIFDEEFIWVGLANGILSPRDHETTRLGVGLEIFDRKFYLGWVGE